MAAGQRTNPSTRQSGYVNYPAAPTLFSKLSDRRLTAEKRALEINIDHLIPGFLVNIRNLVGSVKAPACVIDENI